MSFLDKYVEFLGKYLKYYSNPCCTNLKDKTQSKAKAVYVHSNEVADFSYGSSHPMRPARLGMTLALTKELGLLDPSNTELIEGRKTTEEEVLSFHTEEYLKALKEANSGEAPINGSAFGLGAGDNPAFKGVYDWSLFSAGSSVTCAEVILEGKAERAMNISGGLHHAMADRASGFCYINDPVIAINKLLDAGKRVAYIDIDAHHGDGVEAAYFETDKVLTVSIHESGRYLFPGTGFSKDIGSGKGEGYSVNLPLPPGADDYVFCSAFDAIVPKCIEAFRPDVLVTQLGVDTLASDPVTHLMLTTNGFEYMVKSFSEMDLPWIALGGGGYDMDNVKRAWTLAWAIMAEASVPDHIRDPEITPDKKSHEMFSSITADIDYLLTKVIPLIKTS